MLILTPKQPKSNTPKKHLQTHHLKKRRQDMVGTMIKLLPPLTNFIATVLPLIILILHHYWQ